MRTPPPCFSRSPSPPHNLGYWRRRGSREEKKWSEKFSPAWHCCKPASRSWPGTGIQPAGHVQQRSAPCSARDQPAGLCLPAGRSPLRSSRNPQLLPSESAVCISCPGGTQPLKAGPTLCLSRDAHVHPWPWFLEAQADGCAECWLL